jgi:hypothetical protein
LKSAADLWVEKLAGKSIERTMNKIIRWKFTAGKSQWKNLCGFLCGVRQELLAGQTS